MIGSTLTSEARARNWRAFIIAFFTVFGLLGLAFIWAVTYEERLASDENIAVLSLCEAIAYGQSYTIDERCPERIKSVMDGEEQERG